MVKIVYEGPAPAVNVASQPPFHAVRGEPVDVPGNVAASLVEQRYWRLAEPEAETSAESLDLEAMTNDELRDVLAEMEIDAPSKATKAELIELIRHGPVENGESDG